MDTLQTLALQSWCEASNEGLLVLDTRGTVCLINKRLQDLFKLTSKPETVEELLRQTQNATPELRTLLTQDSTLSTAQWGEMRLPKPSTQRLNWYQIILREGEAAIGSVTIFRDVGVQGQLEVAKQSFLSMISHDLRTPLSTIMGFAELLYHNLGNLSTDEQKEFVEHIIKNATQLSRYTQIALDIMYLEANLQDFQVEQVALGNFVKHWLNDALHRFSATRLVYHNSITDNRNTEIAPAALHKILYILVEFALEESALDEPVDIRLVYNSTQAHILIKHRATKLSPAEVEGLFQLMRPRDLSEAGRPQLHRMQLYVANLLARKQQGYLTLRTGEADHYEIDLALPLVAQS